MSFGIWTVTVLALLVTPAAGQDIEEARAACRAVDYDQALVIARDAARQYMHGVLHEDGRGGPRDLERVTSRHEAAIAPENPDAAPVAGVLYQDGEVLPVDLVHARAVGAGGGDGGATGL